MQKKSNNDSVELNLENIEKIADLMAKYLYKAYEGYNCILAIIDFCQNNPKIAQKFTPYFNSQYRIYFEDLCIKICKFLDPNPKALSIFHLMNISNTNNLRGKLKKTNFTKRIGRWRNMVLCHTELEYALDKTKMQALYDDNKTNIKEISIFLDKLKEVLNLIMKTCGIALTFEPEHNHQTHLQMRDILNLLINENRKLPEKSLIEK